MRQVCNVFRNAILKSLVFTLSLAVALPARAYDFPLSSNAIRDAYFLGVRQGGLTPPVLAPYSQFVPELHQGSCTSEIRLETPFLQIVSYSSGMPNYSSQDAVKEFYDKPMKFRMFLNICYMRRAPPPNSVKIKVIQNKKEIVPETDTRLAYAEPVDGLSVLPANGEKVQLEFDAGKIDSATCVIVIDTPNDQHVKVELDLQNLR
ncbi:MAG TPA: hypothetical protein VFI45_11210 [Candidatus Acidoferrum sp.]|nr:hypothetical protein [Candidatus Acidoferrum sp.]